MSDLAKVESGELSVEGAARSEADGAPGEILRQAQDDKSVGALQDTAWLAGLPDEDRRLFERTKEAMLLIASAGKVLRGAKQAAALFAGLPGFSHHNLRYTFARWNEHGRDDRALVDWSKHPHLKRAVLGHSAVTERSSLPVPFIDFIGGAYLEHKRCFAQVWRGLIARWRNSWHTDEKLPGYNMSARDYWRQLNPAVLSEPVCPRDLPAGWTKTHLEQTVVNWCRITPAEIAYARRGTAALREVLPTIHNSRKDVNYGEHLFADDFHHDLEVIVPGVVPPNQRPLEVGLLDYASAVYGPYVTQATVPGDDGVKRKLGWNCVKWALGRWLEMEGLPLDWTINVHVENATATFDHDEARIVEMLSGGAIKFHWTEMQGGQSLGWAEQRKGNFRGKAPLESAWTLHHNYEAGLPGYIGRNPENLPSVIKGQRAEALLIAKQQAALTPEQKALLHSPLLDYEEFVTARADIVAAINNRTDHQLEGFEKIKLWRYTNAPGFPWQPMSELEKINNAARGFVEVKEFPESPWQRRARLKALGRWVACPPMVLAFVYLKTAEPLTLQNGTFHVRRNSCHWWFICPSRAEMVAAGIEDGREYRVAWNPHHVTVAYIFTNDKECRFLAAWPLANARYGDKAQLAKSLAHRIGLQNEVADNVERLLTASGSLVDDADRRAHNVSVNRQLQGRGHPTENDFTNSAPADSSANDGAALQHSEEDAGAEFFKDGRGMRVEGSAEVEGRGWRVEPDSTVDSQLSTLNSQPSPSTLNSQPSTFSPADDASGEPTIATAAVVRPAEFPAAHETKRGNSLSSSQESGDRRQNLGTPDYILNQRSHLSASATSPDAGDAGLSPAPRHNLRLAGDLTRAVATVKRSIQTEKQARVDRDQFRNRIMAKRQAEVVEANQF